MKKLIILFFIVVPLVLYTAIPPSITALEVTVLSSKGKVVKKAKFNKTGRLSLNGISDAVYKLEIKNTETNKKIVIGNKSSDKVRIDKSTPLLMNVRLSNYQDGEDIILRKRPGRGHGGSSGMATGKRQHSPKVINNNDDDNGGSSRATDYNSSRSNKNGSNAAYIGEDEDCDDLEFVISSKRGSKLEIQAKCK